MDTSSLAPVADSPAEVRTKILALEAVMLQMPQVEFTVNHHFAKGVYARELIIPKGVTVIGKIHKTEHLNILSKGDITVWTDEGMRRIQAPAIIVSKPGIKRVGYTHEDTVWTTVHATDERDLEKLEEIFIAKSFDELEGGAMPLVEGGK